jgi:mycothiol synthase
MKEMGFVKAIIPWVGPIPFYMYHADAKMDRIFWRYEKIME